MINYRLVFLAFILFTSVSFSFSQDDKIKIPAFADKYSDYVKQLEEGNLDIDYTDFRNSFLDSKQFLEKGTNYNDLRKKVNTAIQDRKYQEVVRLTKKMLEIDYTSMFAHKYLHQTYKILGDTINEKKYHDIQFGLLYSITRSGDGKTCETGWHVTQIEEEYFILSMIGARVKSQSLKTAAKNTCDRMDVKTEDGEDRSYFFEINKIFEQTSKLFGN